MSPQRFMPRRLPRGLARGGFTVIELLVVVVVIAILVSLLLPAIGSVRAKAAIAQVKVEISGFDSKITSFKTEFGQAPPSGVTLYEVGGAWSPASQVTIRRLWPQFDFSRDRDINGDGDTNDVIPMNGAECLVFFLGGVTATKNASGNPIRNRDGSLGTAGTPVHWTPLGFSKNARDPFERAGTGTRTGPFHEFDVDRLVNRMYVNTTDLGASVTDQWMPEYIDTLPSQIKPYVYMSSYDGRGYVLTDLTGTGMTNVYLVSDGAPAVGDPTEVPWNQKGFQIISPGFDTLYGNGGVYAAGKTGQFAASGDADNITNFSRGQLE